MIQILCISSVMNKSKYDKFIQSSCQYTNSAGRRFNFLLVYPTMSPDPRYLKHVELRVRKKNSAATKSSSSKTKRKETMAATAFTPSTHKDNTTTATMKKFIAALLLAAPTVSAAPALVWKSQQAQNELKTVHRSAEIPASKMLRDALYFADNNNNGNNKNGLSVVFLVGRREESGGMEGLTAWTREGSLPGVASKCESAETVHYHVSQMESLHTVTNTVASIVEKDSDDRSVMQVSLEELVSKLESLQQQQPPAAAAVVEEKDETTTSEEMMEVSHSGVTMVSKTVHSHNKRARALEAARFLVVNVPFANTDPARLDSAVVQAINAKEHGVDTVVLTAIRSTEEVKQERDMLTRRRMMAMEEDFTQGSTSTKNTNRHHHRRLEDANQAVDDGNQNNQNAASQDMTGIYYVSMTPNILAGLLFTLLFAVVTWIGVSCMGMITGQDVYVSKMPSIGREA
jgi:hypothetical protein